MALGQGVVWVLQIQYAEVANDETRRTTTGTDKRVKGAYYGHNADEFPVGPS
jgi:hypothetical protein